MFELSDKQIAAMIEDESRIETYVGSTKFGFLLGSKGGEVNPFQLLDEHIKNDTSWAERFKNALARIKGLDLLALAELIIQMPINEELEYSSERRTVLYKSMLLRYNKLIKMYEGQDD